MSGSLRLTPPIPNCTFAPLVAGLETDAGHFVVDYNANPPTYSGYGLQYWNITQTCGKDSQNISALDLFLGTLGALAEGQLKGSGYGSYIQDTQNDGNISVTWKFTSCIPTISNPTDRDSCQNF